MASDAPVAAAPSSAPMPAPDPYHPPIERPNWRLGFWSLIATQFQTAFNDNALKFLVIYIIIGMDLAPALRDRLIPLVGALFAVPFIFFSMAGGFFADRYSKRTATIGTKLLEFAVMGFAVLALYLHNLPMECASVFLISSEAALFGPSKYGLLPELLRKSGYPGATGSSNSARSRPRSPEPWAPGILQCAITDANRSRDFCSRRLLASVFSPASVFRTFPPPIPSERFDGIRSAIFSHN